MRTKDKIANDTMLADQQRRLAEDYARAIAAGDATPVDPNYFVMLNADEVAAITRLNIRTVRRAVFDGTFPEPVQLSRGRKLWRKSQVLEFLAGRRSWVPEPEPAATDGKVPAPPADDDDPFDLGALDDLPDDPLEHEGPQLPDDDAGFPF